MINKFKPAFSLAEVMITMVILGIIAMLTIPIFIGNYQDKANQAKLKKSYSALQSAFEMLKDFNYNDFAAVSDFKNSQISETTRVIDQLVKYLHVSKNCGHAEGCWPSSIYINKNKKRVLYDKNMATKTGTSSENYALVLNDGTSVLFTMYVRGTITKNGNWMSIDDDLLNDVNFTAFVDTNGLTGPNALGKDIFIFVLTKEGLLPAGVSNNSQHCRTADISYWGMDCAAQYIFDEDKQ